MEGDRINNHARSSFRGLVQLERDQRGVGLCDVDQGKTKYEAGSDQMHVTQAIRPHHTRETRRTRQVWLKKEMFEMSPLLKRGGGQCPWYGWWISTHDARSDLSPKVKWRDKQGENDGFVGGLLSG